MLRLVRAGEEEERVDAHLLAQSKDGTGVGDEDNAVAEDVDGDDDVAAEAEAAAASVKELKELSKEKCVPLVLPCTGVGIAWGLVAGEVVPKGAWALKEEEGASYRTRMLASLRSVLTKRRSNNAILSTSFTGKHWGARSPAISS